MINSQESEYIKSLLSMPVINCVGTMSVLGGSRMNQQVLEAMNQTSKSFVHMQDLNHRAASIIDKLAKLPNDYGSFICGGAASGLTLSVATCIIENDHKKIQMLPSQAKNLKNLIIIDKNSDDRWLQCLEIPGGTLVKIDLNNQNLENAIIQNKEKLAAITIFAGGYFTDRDSDFKQWVEISHKHGIPVICDAAAQLPPRSNLLKFVNIGFDFVLFSGGKARGPQSTGLIFAKKQYIEILGANASPNELTIGRPMKCDKESIVGLVKAFEIFVSKSDEEELQQYDEINDYFKSSLLGHEKQFPKGIEQVRRVCPGSPEIQPNIIPRIYIDLDINLLNKPKKKEQVSYKEIPIFENQPDCLSKYIVYDLFTKCKPAIAINFSGDSSLIFNPQTISKEESKYVADKIKEILNQYI